MESYEQKRAHALQLANRRRTGGKLSFLAHWARIIIVSLALFVVIRAFGVEAFKIASGSMEHTLFEGDFLLINKLVYGAGIPGSGRKLPAIHSPRRGDVIMFTRSEEHTSELQSLAYLVCRLLLEKKKITSQHRIVCRVTNTPIS